MSEPKWVTSAEVALINQRETERTNEPFGVLKPGELDSACDRARNYYAYGETDLHKLAATYAEGVAQNHPFEQGNKRSAFMATHLFLAKNNVELLPREDDGYVDMMRDLVNGERSRDDVAEYLAENSREMTHEKTEASSERDEVMERYEDTVSQIQSSNENDNSR